MNYYSPNIINALEALGFSDVTGAIIDTEAGYKDLKIYSEKTVPTWVEVSKKLEELQADYDAKQYQRDRNYPNIGEQLDMLWHAIDNGEILGDKSCDFFKTLKKVKDDNPKPE